MQATDPKTGLPPGWELRWSRTQKMAYSYNLETRTSTWEVPLESNTDLLIPYTKQYTQHQLRLQAGGGRLDGKMSATSATGAQETAGTGRPDDRSDGEHEPTEETHRPTSMMMPTSTTTGKSGSGGEEYIRCAHLLVKHIGSRNRLNWKGEQISRTEAEARSKIAAHRAEIAADPVLFRRLVTEQSDCASAQNGGDLGFFARGEMQKEFEQAAYALKEGQFSGIISTPSGLHIIYRIELDPEQLLRYQQQQQQQQHHSHQLRQADQQSVSVFS